MTMRHSNGKPMEYYLRPFDLKVGDLIKITEPLGYSKANIFRVTKLYEHFFMAEHLKGKFRVTYQRKEYQIGHIQKFLGSGHLAGFIDSLSAGLDEYKATQS